MNGTTLIFVCICWLVFFVVYMPEAERWWTCRRRRRQVRRMAENSRRRRKAGMLRKD